MADLGNYFDLRKFPRISEHVQLKLNYSGSLFPSFKLLGKNQKHLLFKSEEKVGRYKSVENEGRSSSNIFNGEHFGQYLENLPIHGILTAN